MYQEKEFLSALSQLPKEDDIEILKNKYNALVLFNIANRCVNKGLIDENKISFSISHDRNSFVFVSNNIEFDTENNVLTEKGKRLLI